MGQPKRLATYKRTDSSWHRRQGGNAGVVGTAGVAGHAVIVGVAGDAGYAGDAGVAGVASNGRAGGSVGGATP
jgi:hypothetical protein